MNFKILLISALIGIDSASASGSLGWCLKNNKKETLDKYYAVKRAIQCQNSYSILSCNALLGIGAIGAGVLAGAKAAEKIRNPNFNICSVRTSNIIFFDFVIPAANAENCIDPKFLKRTLIEYAAKQGLADLDTLESTLDRQIMQASPRAKTLLDYEREEDRVLEKINEEMKKNKLWAQYEKDMAERDLLRTQIRDPQLTPENKDLLRKKYAEVQIRINDVGQRIASAPDLKHLYEAQSQANSRRHQFMEGLLKEDLTNDPTKEQFIRNALAEKDRVSQAKAAYKRILQSTLGANSQTLESLAGEITDIGYTSPAQKEHISSLHFQKSGSSNFLRRGFSKIIKPFVSKIGVAGVLVTAATASSASEIVPEVISGIAFTSSTGCTELHSYLDYKNETGSCTPSYEINSKSIEFFELDESKIENAILGNTNMCELIDELYYKFYPPKRTVTCGSEIKISTPGQPPLILKPQGDGFSKIELETPEGHFVLNLTNDGNIKSLKQTIRAKISFYTAKTGRLLPDTIKAPTREKDPFLYSYAQQELAKQLPSLLEISSCCKNDGLPRPSDSECRQRGVNIVKSQTPLKTQGSGIR